jgi:hypothetical protein
LDYYDFVDYADCHYDLIDNRVDFGRHVDFGSDFAVDDVDFVHVHAECLVDVHGLYVVLGRVEWLEEPPQA